MSDERYKKIIGVLIAAVTLITTMIAFLESEAGFKDDRANRDAQSYAMLALGDRISGSARTNYDYYTAYQAWYELDALALASEFREDEATAERYRTVRDRLIESSPLLSPEYFDPETGEIDIARYESDVYLMDITRLTENYSAASVVKDGWGTKASTYVVHLTLLAISLFLLGLSTTVSISSARTIFVITGMGIALFVAGWAALIYSEPVYDLRAVNGAIDNFAQGVSLAYQDRSEEAVSAFDKALTVAPDYVNAMAERGSVYMTMGDYEKAAADFEAARAKGDQRSWVAGNLAYAYFSLGRFENAITVSRETLTAYPDETWIRFDLALSLLASGQTDAALAEYQTAMDNSTQQVISARASGQQPSSDIWWALDDAASELEYLMFNVETLNVAAPDTILAEAEKLFIRLKGLSVALELTSAPPQGELTAEISPFEFGMPIYDEDSGELIEYEINDTFEAGTDEVSVLFDYEGMRENQPVVFKVYIDEEEDPTWRAVYEWNGGDSGSYEYSLSLSYSDIFILDPGEYVIEFYVDSHLAQRGAFTVLEE